MNDTRTLTRRIRAAAAAMAVAAFVPGQAHALFTVSFDLDGGNNPIANGQILDDEYTLANGGVVDGDTGATVGLTISAQNGGGGPDHAVAFNTGLTGTSDPDLEAPFTQMDGSAHTNAALSNPGNIIIVQENTTGCGDGICDDPDDEGGGPNTVTYEFTSGVTLFSIDLFDVDGTPDAQNETVTLELTTSADVVHTFTNFGTGGDNTSERVFFDLGVFDVVRLAAIFSSSGAMSNIRGQVPGISVPEPATALLLGLALGGLGARRIRQRG